LAGKEQIMTAIYDMDPSTCTIAAAWASSEFGDPETGPTEFWHAPDDESPERKATSITRHAGLVAALAGVFGAGAAFGLAVFDFADWAQPTITLPYVSTQDVGTPGTPHVAPSAAASTSKPVVAAPGNAPAPTVSAPAGAPAAGVAPTSDYTPGPVEIVSPPANSPGDAKVTVDLALPGPPNAVPVPDLPEPELASPEPETTLQLAPGPDSTALQPQQPPTLTKVPKLTQIDVLPQAPKRKSDQATKQSPRAIAKP
jgi:hypothetical protein